MQKQKTVKNKILIMLALALMLNWSFYNTAKGQVDYNDDIYFYGDDDDIKQLNNEIDLKKDLIKQKQNQQEALKKAIVEKQQEKASLNNQVAIINNRLEKAKIDIETTEMEIEQVNLEIKKINVETEDTNLKIENEKGDIAKTLNLIHKQDGVSTLEVLLLNESLSDFLSQLKYLENLNSEIKSGVDNLTLLKQQLEKNNQNLNTRKTDLEKLKSDLAQKQGQLSGEQESKIYLLEETKSSEAEYQRLLQLAKREQEQASSDIYSLEKKVREKMAEISRDKISDANGFMWPVPRNVITAYFHDPEYPYRKVFEHPAVDIRAAQGTSLRAASSGYVARARNAGMGYSYIMIVHADGLSTVYGHVSRISVSEDEFVKQGQVIGATGGTPGTPGAGNMTTGPHLHFEVRLNGIPVNPLEYLP